MLNEEKSMKTSVAKGQSPVGSYAAVINNYLHLMGAGRRVVAIAPRGKAASSGMLLMRWGDDILQRDVMVQPDKIARYIINHRPSVATLQAQLQTKWDKLNQHQ